MMKMSKRLTRTMAASGGLCIALTAGLGWDVPAALAQAKGRAVGPAAVAAATPRMHVIVRVKPGIEPVQNADGQWMFRRAADGELEGGQANHAAEAAALAAVLANRGVTHIVPTITVKPNNIELFRAHRLDRYYNIHMPAGNDAAEVVNELQAFTNHVEAAVQEMTGGIAVMPNDSSFWQQWNMHNTGQSGGAPDADVDAPECWDVYQGSNEIVVAVLDTGIQQQYTQMPPNPDASTVDHPDLVGRVIPGYDFWDNNSNSTDYHGHGTHCAGTIAANANNGIGIAGLNWNAKVMAIKVVNDSGSASLPLGATPLVNGIVYAVNNGAHVLSMSLQFSSTTLGNPDEHPLKDTVAFAYDSGVLPVGASGNQGSATTISYPAKYPKCMAVGATNKTDIRWPLSNGGPELDLCAPGDQVYSLTKLSGYASMSGTSMATPHVSAVASLIYSFNPSLMPADIEGMLTSTADDKGAAGWDNLYGWGRLNANAALLAAAPVPCPEDIAPPEGNGSVNVDDLLMVINSWGDCPQPPATCEADIAPPGGNGLVNVDDLLAVINAWGACE